MVSYCQGLVTRHDCREMYAEHDLTPTPIPIPLFEAASCLHHSQAAINDNHTPRAPGGGSSPHGRTSDNSGQGHL